MPPPPSLHVAQFYEDDDEGLVEFLANFVQAGLQNNETMIIIATAPHVSYAPPHTYLSRIV